MLQLLPFLLQSATAPIGVPSPPAIGAVTLLSRSEQTTNMASDGSSGSSSTGGELLQRVVVVSDGGVEYEFDLAADATEQDRLGEWQFPARIFRPSKGPDQLINMAEMEVRLEKFLTASKWKRDICGRWIFTWTAFHIDCDPKSVLAIVDGYMLPSCPIHDEMELTHNGGLGTASLRRHANGVWGAEFDVDPEVVRKQQVDTEKVLAQLLPPEQLGALADADKQIVGVSGTIKLTFEVDAASCPIRRVAYTKMEVRFASGKRETLTHEEIVAHTPIVVSNENPH